MAQATPYPDDVSDILAEMERAGLEPKQAARFAARLIAIGAGSAPLRPETIVECVRVQLRRRDAAMRGGNEHGGMNGTQAQGGGPS